MADRNVSIFSILIAFLITGLIFYILKSEIDLSLDQLSSSYISEYKSIISLMMLLVILLILLMLAITCTYSRFLQMFGVDEQTEMQRNQIFFNLIQLNIENFVDTETTSNDDVQQSLNETAYDTNPPDYNSIIMDRHRPHRLKTDSDSEIDDIERQDMMESCFNANSLPPSYEVALFNRSNSVQVCQSVPSHCCLAVDL